MPIIIEQVLAPADYGHQKNQSVHEVTITRQGLVLRLLTLGAAIRSVEIANAAGALEHVHLHLPDVADYAVIARNPHLGATIGRYANRIGNAQFTLDGTTYELDANRPPHMLHGGEWGFDRLVWHVTVAESVAGEPDCVTFALTSPDGEMGFPGTLVATSTYVVSDDQITFVYEATSDADTVVSFTNHGYWNLSGEPTIADHTLQLAASRVLDIGDDLVPTGAINSVADTPLDLQTPTRLGTAIANTPNGLDHCFIVDGADLTSATGLGDAVNPVAVLTGGDRWMSVASDCPAVQIYTGNSLKPPFHAHQSVSIETQRLPDAPNHENFGPFLLCAGQTYQSTTVLTFGTGPAPALDSLPS